jgi:hypothetical protein
MAYTFKTASVMVMPQYSPDVPLRRSVNFLRRAGSTPINQLEGLAGVRRRGRARAGGNDRRGSTPVSHTPGCVAAVEANQISTDAERSRGKMKRKATTALLVALTATGCVSHTWAPGPTAAMPFEQASGQCQLVAMGMEQPTFSAASGSTSFVVGYTAGAQLGGAIGNAIRSNRAYNACMEAHGFVEADQAIPMPAAVGGRVSSQVPASAPLASAPLASALPVSAPAVSAPAVIGLPAHIPGEPSGYQSSP